jgi:hypothetical protein
MHRLSGSRVESDPAEVGALQGRSRCRRPRPPPSMLFRRHQSALATSRPHRHRDSAHPAHICTRTGLTPPTSAPGLARGVPGPSHVCTMGLGLARTQICLKVGLTPPTWTGLGPALLATQVAVEKGRDARAADRRRAGVRRGTQGTQGTQAYSGVLRRTQAYAGVLR